jgi:AcrR family transcriptional regulator
VNYVSVNTEKIVMPERGRPRTFDRTAALRQAMELFWAKGYEGTSIADLTAAMGISSPSLYAAFGSKEALFLEATEYYTRNEGTEIWSALDEAPTACQAIENFLRQTAKAYSQDDRPQGCLIALGALHQDSSSGAICDDLRRRRAENHTLLLRRLERGVAEGGDLLCDGPARHVDPGPRRRLVRSADGHSGRSDGGVAGAGRNSVTKRGACAGNPVGGECAGRDHP